MPTAEQGAAALIDHLTRTGAGAETLALAVAAPATGKTPSDGAVAVADHLAANGASGVTIDRCLAFISDGGFAEHVERLAREDGCEHCRDLSAARARHVAALGSLAAVDAAAASLAAHPLPGGDDHRTAALELADRRAVAMREVAAAAHEYELARRGHADAAEFLRCPRRGAAVRHLLAAR